MFTCQFWSYTYSILIVVNLHAHTNAFLFLFLGIYIYIYIHPLYSHHVNSVILNIIKRKFFIARWKENYSSEYNKKTKIFREICIKDWCINCNIIGIWSKNLRKLSYLHCINIKEGQFICKFWILCDYFLHRITKILAINYKKKGMAHTNQKLVCACKFTTAKIEYVYSYSFRIGK